MYRSYSKLKNFNRLFNQILNTLQNKTRTRQGGVDNDVLAIQHQ